MMNALSLQIQTKEYFLRDKPQKSEIAEKSESREKSEKESEVGEEQSVVRNELKKGRKCHAVQEELSAPKVTKMQQGSTLLEIVTNVTTNTQQSTNKSQKHSLPKKWMGKGSASPIILSSESEDMGELGDSEIQEEERYKQEQYLELEKENQKREQSVSKSVGTKQKQKQSAVVTNKTARSSYY